MTPANTIEPASRTTMSKTGITAWRIRFVPAVPAGAEVVGQFADPMAAFAVAEPLDPLATTVPAVWPEPVDQLDVLVRSSPPDSDAMAAAWLNPPDHADAPLPISIAIGRGQLSWRPGRALVESANFHQEALAALAEFSFYEGQLRRLEGAVLPYEASAVADASKAYRMTSNARDHWDRFGATMESLALLRLTFARLEPRLLTPSRGLPPASRRLIRQLSRRAAIEDRLSALNDRLEACEDLYEGAIDRITDDRWYRKGNLLEIIIVILLLIEVVQLGGDMAMRWLRDHMH
jgi:hypothetical protein